MSGSNASATASLFARLLDAFSFQGISDHVAASYLDQHGRVNWKDIEGGIKSGCECPKLRSYWAFHGCGYQKTKRTCARPRLLARCPLPRHDMRNGRLNQTAYSLFLFVRDVAGGNLENWIDHQLRTQSKFEGLVSSFRFVFGVSDKVLNMALSDLLLTAPTGKRRWRQAGLDMIAVDTLVHNFLHRTGILARFTAVHPYGTGCYADGGCAHLLRRISARIDATKFSASYPKHFPRFVQHAVWRFCAQRELNVCNGNQINDRARCDQTTCQLFALCDRVALQSHEPDGG